MASKLQAIALLAGTLGFAAGCSDSYGPGQATVQGTYALVTFNGSALPATFVDQGITLRINSGGLTLNSGNSFTSTLNLSVLIAGQQPQTVSANCTGTYSRSGMTITFTTVATTDCEGGNDIGTWDGGDTVTVADASGTFVFRR